MSNTCAYCGRPARFTYTERDRDGKPVRDSSGRTIKRRFEIVVTHRTGTSTRTYHTCMKHKPKRRATSSDMGMIADRRAIGPWGLVLRKIAGM